MSGSPYILSFFSAQRKPNARLEIYKAFQDCLTFLKLFRQKCSQQTERGTQNQDL